MDKKLEALAAELARILDVDHVDIDISMSELGTDSMMIVELAIVAEELYGRPINLEHLGLDDNISLRELLRRIDALATPA